MAAAGLIGPNSHAIGGRAAVGFTGTLGVRASSSSATSSVDKLANLQMEPTRPTVCAIMSPRRAAHLARYTDRTESLFSQSFFARWGFNTRWGVFAVSVGTHRAPSNIRVVCRRAVSVSSSAVFRAAARGRCVERGRSRVLGSSGLWCGARRAPLSGSEAGALAVVPSVRGSFDGRYNLRLHLTAPRAHRLDSARGERVSRVGQLDGLVHVAQALAGSASFTTG